MLTSSGSTGGRGGDAKTIISPNTSFGDITNKNFNQLQTYIHVYIHMYIHMDTVKHYASMGINTYTYTCIRYPITFTP